jgi:Domain of unknown function (DUF5127)
VTDGKTHNIQLYVHVQPGSCSSHSTDVHIDPFSPGSFVSDSVQNMTWATVSAKQSVFEMAELQTQQPFSENAQGQAEWGRFYFATARVRFYSKIYLVYVRALIGYGVERCRHL